MMVGAGVVDQDSEWLAVELVDVHTPIARAVRLMPGALTAGVTAAIASWHTLRARPERTG